MPCILCFPHGRQPLLQHTGTAGRACPSGLAGMILQGGPGPMLCATKPCQGSEHLIPETGNWGHLEPCDPCQKARSPSSDTVSGQVPWTRAQELMLCGSHLVPTSKDGTDHRTNSLHAKTSRDTPQTLYSSPPNLPSHPPKPRSAEAAASPAAHPCPPWGHPCGGFMG